MDYIRRRRRALLDPRRDVVLLQDPPDQRGGTVLISSLATLTLCLNPYIRNNLRFLAIPYYNWRKARLEGLLKHLLAFKVLERLYVPFMEGMGNSTDWSGAVGVEIEGHIREVEEEVRSDLEMLAVTHPGWRKPELRVVRHRHSMAEMLGMQD